MKWPRSRNGYPAPATAERGLESGVESGVDVCATKTHRGDSMSGHRNVTPWTHCVFHARLQSHGVRLGCGSHRGHQQKMGCFTGAPAGLLISHSESPKTAVLLGSAARCSLTAPNFATPKLANLTCITGIAKCLVGVDGLFRSVLGY